MPPSSKSTLVRTVLCAVVIAAAACSPRKIPPMTVSDLMEDRVKLDGVILKCNENPARARNDSDCMNARIAVERLGSQHDASSEAKTEQEFERNREQLRSLQERQRQDEESKSKVDAYQLPLIPVEPAQPPPPRDPQAPIMGQIHQRTPDP